MLNLTSSDKTSENDAVPPVSAIIADLTHSAFVGAHLHTCLALHEISPLVRQVVASRVDVLARRFRLTSNKYIIHESANMKVCQYQVRTRKRYTL